MMWNEFVKNFLGVPHLNDKSVFMFYKKVLTDSMVACSVCRIYLSITIFKFSDVSVQSEPNNKMTRVGFD